MRILSPFLAAAGLILAAPATAFPQQVAPPSLSEGGKKAIETMAVNRTTAMAPLLKRKAELQAEFDALLTPASYDAVKLRALMPQMQTVESELYQAMGGSMLTLLEELPEADRAVFMKSLTRKPSARAVSGR